MSRMIFDDIGEKMYRYGVSHVAIYLQVNGSYPEGAPFNGVTAVNQNPSGAEENAIYADNIKYASMVSAEEFGATVEAVWYPEEMAIADGEASIDDIPGVHVSQQKRRPFGLTWRNELGSDTFDEEKDGYELHLAYGLIAKPSSKSSKTTNSSPENETESWELTSTPVPVTGMKPTAHIRINTTELTGEAKKNLDVLEEILYGNDDADGRLPLPDEVFSILKTGRADS